MAQRQSSTYGFARTSSLLRGRIRKASESRGFAQARLLTHWAEIAGDKFAAISPPRRGRATAAAAWARR